MDIQKDFEIWVKTLKGWQTELAFRLLSQETLSETDMSEIIEMLKSDSPFTDKPLPNIGSVTGNHIVLKSISNICNIERLAPRNPLEFADAGLTVIYGDNGAGKSGYTRILKKVCGKPGIRDLIGNIYSEDKTVGQCNIYYSIGDTDKSVTWKITDTAISDLVAVDIFDTDTGLSYLRDANTISYIPPIIAFFQRFTEHYDTIKEKLSAEKEALVSHLPQPPTNLQSSTFIKHYLSSTIDPAQFTWSDDDENSRILLESRLKEVDPQTAATKLQEQKSKLAKVIEALCVDANKVSAKAYDNILQLAEEAKAKSQAVEDAGKVLDESAKLQGVGSTSWRYLWNAAKEFATKEAYKSDSKTLGEQECCVLCHQILNPDAKRRMHLFENFISDKISQEAASATKAYEEAIRILPTLVTQDDIDNRCIASGLDEDWRKQIFMVWTHLCDNGKRITNGEPPTNNYTEEINTAISALKAHYGQYEKMIVELEADTKEFDKVKIQNELLELTARKWSTEQINAIVTESERQEQCKRYATWISQTNTRAITSKANEIADSVITQEYANRFNNELRKLGADKIKITIQKHSSKGVIRHSLQINNAEHNNPIGILSEGEMRVIALAAFLADVAGGNQSNPFIFDDPISSLDQTYEEKAIKRLLEMSVERQVIVFTHRLSLLGQLYDGNNALRLVGIRSEHWGSGEIGKTPIFTQRPDKALRNMQSDMLTKAKKKYETEGYDAYYPDGKAICSDIRIIVERIIESTLLADLVVRFRRPITTKGKIPNLAKINEDDCKMVDKFMTKYSFFEHSQPAETPVKIPQPSAIQADIDELLTWLDEFAKRK